METQEQSTIKGVNYSTTYPYNLAQVQYSPAIGFPIDMHLSSKYNSIGNSAYLCGEVAKCGFD